MQIILEFLGIFSIKAQTVGFSDLTLTLTGKIIKKQRMRVFF